MELLNPSLKKTSYTPGRKFKVISHFLLKNKSFILFLFLLRIDLYIYFVSCTFFHQNHQNHVVSNKISPLFSNNTFTFFKKYLK